MRTPRQIYWFDEVGNPVKDLEWRDKLNSRWRSAPGAQIFCFDRFDLNHTLPDPGEPQYKSKKQFVELGNLVKDLEWRDKLNSRWRSAPRTQRGCESSSTPLSCTTRRRISESDSKNQGIEKGKVMRWGTP